MKRLSLFFCCFLAAVPVARAQTACPVGVSAGSAQCGPSPSEHLPPSQASSAPRVNYVPTGEWIETWGAISSDAATGDIGVSVGKMSKSKAQRDAVAQCVSLGSKDCEVVLTYINQCAVIVSAEPGTGGNVIFQGAATIEVATNLAMPKCRSGKAPGSCKVVYSACSESIFKKY